MVAGVWCQVLTIYMQLSADPYASSREGCQGHCQLDCLWEDFFFNLVRARKPGGRQS